MGIEKYSAYLAGQYDPEVTITVTKKFSKQELWDAITGAGFYACSWWRKIVLNEDKLEATLGIEDPNAIGDYDNYITKTLTIDDIAEACAKVWAGEHYHCFVSRIDDNIDDYDACCADTILQVAMLGEVVYA
jgi:hypothetical protein